MPFTSKSDLVLALLYGGDTSTSLNAPIGGMTRLEKYVFLVSKETDALSQLAKPSDRYEFTPYKMGPFSPEVYDETDFLKALGLISYSPYSDSTGSAEVELDALVGDQVLDKYQRADSRSVVAEDSTLRLTDQGLQIARQVYASLTGEEQKFIADLKTRFNQASLKEFLRYVYRKYPEYAIKSEIKEYLDL